MFIALALALVSLGAVGLLVLLRTTPKPPATVASEAPAPPVSIGKAAPKRSASAKPTRVKLRVVSKPASVDVYLGEEKIGQTSDSNLQIDRGDREVELTFKAKGYLDKTLKIKPTASLVLSVDLKPVARPRVRKTGGGELEF